jgi:hypothetical protein
MQIRAIRDKKEERMKKIESTWIVAMKEQLDIKTNNVQLCS